MCDQEKSKRRKPHAKPHIMKQHRPKQKNCRPSEDDDTPDIHSTAEDSLLSDARPDHQRRSRRYHRKQIHGRLSLSETSLTSSSSSFSSSSLSTSASSSLSSSSSGSSSSVSSESSSDCLDGVLPRRPRHSLSCTDISRKHKNAEDVEETSPLSDHLAKQKQGAQKKTQKTARGSANDGSFRKTRSMEALTCSTESERHAAKDEKEQEKRKNEVRQNLMKEKMKFSAFLNEITRQVLSPMRLTTLGVTDAQKQSSTGSAFVSSRKLESNQQQRSRPVSGDSVSSSKCSHSQLSSSSHHHRRHRSPDSTEPVQPKPRSCTDISCLERHPSRSTQHGASSPSCKRRHHRYQESHTRRRHHHSDTPSYQRHRSVSPRHHHRYYSPVFSDHGEHDGSTYHNKHPHRREDIPSGDRYSPDHHHRRDYRDSASQHRHDQHFHYPHGYRHGQDPCHGDRYCRDDRTYPPREIHRSSQDHEDHQSPDHHHCNHLNTKCHVTPRRGNHGQSCVKKSVELLCIGYHFFLVFSVLEVLIIKMMNCAASIA